MRRLLTAVLVIGACWSASALAADGAQNLRIYTGLLTDLRAAHQGEIGPLLGYRCVPEPGSSKKYCGTFHIFYARYRGKEYAAADFWSKTTGGTDATEQFDRPVGGRWRDRGDGWPPNCGFPAAVVKVWGWEPCT